MGVRRTALPFEGQFTQIPNEWLRDKRLSRKARGLLAEIMTHRVGWHVTTRTLTTTGPEGRDAVRAALSELVEMGYLRRAQSRGEGGTFGEIEYELSEPPTVAGKADHGEETPGQTVAGFTAVGSPAVGSSVAGKSATKNTRDQEHHQEEDHPPVVPRGDAVGEALDVLWSLWPTPRRGTTKKAASSFRTAITANGGIRHIEVVLAAARRDVEVWRTWAPGDVQFIPLLSTWLNQGRWEPQAAALPRSTQRTYAQRQQENTLSLVERYKQEEARNAEVRDGGAGGVRGIDRGA